MNMPKSRELQAKIPSPKAIFIGFLIVTVKVLNSYDLFFVENNRAVVDELIVGRTDAGFIEISAEGQKQRISVVSAVISSFFISCGIFNHGGVLVQLGAGHFVDVILVGIFAALFQIGSGTSREKGIVDAADSIEHGPGVENGVGILGLSRLSPRELVSLK